MQTKFQVTIDAGTIKAETHDAAAAAATALLLTKKMPWKAVVKECGGMGGATKEIVIELGGVRGSGSDDPDTDQR